MKSIHVIILLVTVLIGLLTIPKQSEGFYSPNFFTHGAVKHYLFDGKWNSTKAKITDEFKKYYNKNKGKVSDTKAIKEKLNLTTSKDTADLTKIYWYVKKNVFIKNQRDALHKKLDNVTKSLKEISTKNLEIIRKDLYNFPSNEKSEKQFFSLKSKLNDLTKSIDSKFAELDSKAKNLTIEDTPRKLVISGLDQDQMKPVDESILEKAVTKSEGDFVVSNVVNPNISIEGDSQIDDVDPVEEAQQINTSIVNGTTVEAFRGWGR